MPTSSACFLNLLPSLKFKWLSKGMKCMGIKLNPNISEIIATNLEILLDKIKS